MQPAKWAALYANGTEYPALHPILEVFLRAKGSQSVAERGWSAVDFVCGPRRKRLCPERQQLLMDGFWWFGHTKPSKQCDLLRFHQDVDDDESGETTNDEDLDMDGPIEAANVMKAEETLGVLEDDDTHAVTVQLDESMHRARLEAAKNSEKDFAITSRSQTAALRMRFSRASSRRSGSVRAAGAMADTA